MNNFLVRLREVVWVSVIAAALGITAILVAILFPAKLILVLGIGSAAITFAILAQRI
jgi:hypothetical protein